MESLPEITASPSSSSSPRGDVHQVVTFALGAEEYGVEIAQVQEINRMGRITRVPRTPDFMDGVINLRGQLIPILDLRTRFGMARTPHSKHTRIVVTEVGGRRVGLVVDGVSEVVRIPHEQIEAAPPLINGERNRYIRGVGKMEERLIILLDLQRIISRDEQSSLADGLAAMGQLSTPA